MKVETTTPDGKKTARIKIRFRHGQLQSPKVQIKNPSQLRNTSAICEQNKEISSNNRSATSKNGSLRKEVNESLSNLQQDISSIIEQSFGSVQVILTWFFNFRVLCYLLVYHFFQGFFLLSIKTFLFSFQKLSPYWTILLYIEKLYFQIAQLYNSYSPVHKC